MSSFIRNLKKSAIAAAALVALSPAHAVLIGGVDFPDGISSFADAVASYDPVIKSGQPTVEHRQPATALGAPDYNGSANTFVSLGDGGSITLEFVDNRLTGSGDTKLDLWVFEIGPDVEDTFVEISKDGSLWSAVGKVAGSTAGVDIDAFGFDRGDLIQFVRLTDDGSRDNQTGVSVGADIDAVGAITSVVPEPETYALMLVGLATIGFAVRRRTR
jgi:hypothetical protein